MALTLKFDAREEIPAGLEAFYVERDGAWHLDVEPAGLPNDESRISNAPHPGPLPSAEREKKPREKWTIADEMAAREAQMTQMRLEADVQRIGREHGGNAKALEALVQRARGAFRIVGGRAVALAADGRTALRSADGRRELSVSEWTRAQVAGAAEGFAERPSGFDAAAMPLRNPFQRKFWNLTEQMRLRKADPEHAARLKAEAWQEGN